MQACETFPMYRDYEEAWPLWTYIKRYADKRKWNVKFSARDVGDDGGENSSVCPEQKKWN